VSQKQLFHSYVSWLIVTEKTISAVDFNSTIEERLRYINIGPDTDLVIATKMDTAKEHISGNKTWSRGDRLHNNWTYRRGKRGVPVSVQKIIGGQSLYVEENVNNHERIQKQKEQKHTRNNISYSYTNKRNNRYNEIGNCRENAYRTKYSAVEFSLFQAYKIRPNSNSSLIIIPLGSWNAISGTLNLVSPNGIEQRNNFRGLPLFVGVRNASQNTAEVGGGAIKDTSLLAQSSEDDSEDDNHLMDVLDFIARSLNARFVICQLSPA